MVHSIPSLGGGGNCYIDQEVTLDCSSSFGNTSSETYINCTVTISAPSGTAILSQKIFINCSIIGSGINIQPSNMYSKYCAVFYGCSITSYNINSITRGKFFEITNWSGGPKLISCDIIGCDNRTYMLMCEHESCNFYNCSLGFSSSGLSPEPYDFSSDIIYSSYINGNSGVVFGKVFNSVLYGNLESTTATDTLMNCYFQKTSGGNPKIQGKGKFINCYDGSTLINS